MTKYSSNLIYRYGQKAIKIDRVLNYTTDFVNLSEQFNTKDKIVLLKIQHHKTITILNLTGITPYMVLYFDEDLWFTGAAFAVQSTSGSFSINTEYKNILFCNIDLKIEVKNLLRFEKENKIIHHKDSYDYYLEYRQKLFQISDEELISSFNEQVGVCAWGTARQGYLRAIEAEIVERNIDYSSIGNDKIMSHKHIVFLRDNKLYKFSELSKEDASKIFQNYMQREHPDKMKFKPKLSTYDDEVVKFGMIKHYGVLVLPTKKLCKPI